jgi:hypothetical protein
MPKKHSKSQPVHEIRLGKIKAAIWANDTEKGTRYNVTIRRLYKDGETWKDSATLGRDDLLLASKVLDQAHDWILANANGVKSAPAKQKAKA